MSADTGIGTLAITVTRGSSNNLFQVATLVRAATALEASVRVLFRSAAVQKLTRDRVNAEDWSPAYRPVVADLAQRLRAADFVDMESFLRDAKEHGDDVRFWASRESLMAAGLEVADLVGSIDEALTDAEFAEIVRHADVSLTF